MIFNCVNNIIELIFNEYFVKKKRFVSSMNNAQDQLKLKK